jgi:multicomponent Na+:H+ antiporter subunit D
MFNAILQHLPVLMIALPILFAPIIAILPTRKRDLCWLLAYGVCGLIFLWSCYLMLQVSSVGEVTYYMGNWPPPFGIEYKAGLLNSFMLVLISGMAFLTMIFAMRSVDAEIGKPRIPAFYACFLMLVSGLMGMVITNDIFNIYVFLEISSITAYALVALGKSKQALIAAFNYLVVGTIGGVFFLFGVGLLYSQTGTLNFSDNARILASIVTNKVIVASLVFMLMGLMIKAALFPLSFWLPNAYAQAPTVVSSFLSSTATKVAIYLVIRIIYELFGNVISFEILHLDRIILTLAMAGIIFGSITACLQNELRRMFAYSSVAGVGYIFLALFSDNSDAFVAALLLILTHSLAKAGLFMFAGICSDEYGSTKISKLEGMGKKYPAIAVSVVILGASMIGLPLVGGFISKWYLLGGLIDNEAYFSLSVIAVGTICAVIYMWKIIEVIYFHSASETTPRKNHAEFPLTILAFFTFLIGVYPMPLISYFSKIAQEFIK